jgi:hypothetical protein
MVGHVESLQGELHWRVLLLLHALEPFEVDYEEGRGAEDLELFHRLFVHLAPDAEPGVLVRELLWGHELAETVINGDNAGIALRGVLPTQRPVRKGPGIEARADKVLVDGPTPRSIEGHL